MICFICTYFTGFRRSKDDWRHPLPASVLFNAMECGYWSGKISIKHFTGLVCFDLH